jgi:hypothetical protein
MASKAVICALQALERDGRLSPQGVVNEAKRKDSPLHDQFEWDDKVAGVKYRLEQAARLIVSVKIQITHYDMPLRVPQYVRDAAPTAESGYVNILTIKSESDQAREVMIEEMKRVINAANRAKAVAAALSSDRDIAEISKIAGRVLRKTSGADDDSQAEGRA